MKRLIAEGHQVAAHTWTHPVCQEKITMFIIDDTLLGSSRAGRGRYSQRNDVDGAGVAKSPPHQDPLVPPAFRPPGSTNSKDPRRHGVYLNHLGYRFYRSEPVTEN